MKKTALAAVILALLAIPCAALIAAVRAPAAPPSDCAACDFLAVTDGDGREFVCPAGDALFSAMADAFASAAPAALPSDDGAFSALTLAWIRDGAAREYALRLYAAPLSAYLTDGMGNIFRLPDGAGAVLLASDAGEAARRVGRPASLSAGEAALPCTLTEWRWDLSAYGIAAPLSAFSESAAPLVPPRLSAAAPAPVFSRRPDALRYTLYRGSEPVGAGDGLPVPADLAPGDYQVVLTASFESGPLTLRAAYTYLLSV